MPEKLLILGGTREAYQLAENLDAKLPHEKINFISSLAGTTKKPNIPEGTQYEIKAKGGKANSSIIFEQETDAEMLLERVKDKIDLFLHR